MSTIILTVTITNDEDYQDLHITDNWNHSCNYGDSNYDNGMTAKSVGSCVGDFLTYYHGMKGKGGAK